MDRGPSYSNWAGNINNAYSVEAPLSISFSGSFDYMTNNGVCNVVIEPDAPLTGSYKLYLVLVEDELIHSNYTHGSVMRDMIPTSSGLTIDMTSGQSMTEIFDFELDNSFVLENCRLVAFVQNTANKAILNAGTIHVSGIAPVNIPNLSLYGMDLDILNDDGDDKLNPGESTNLAVSVENNCDWVDADNVMGYLSSTSPYVTIGDSIGTYDLIVACDFIGNTTDQYQLSVSPDAPAVSELEFELRLTANQSSEAPYETIIPFTISMNFFQNHFPVAVTQPFVSGNAVVDLNGDGNKEIIIGGTDSLLHVITSNGSELAGFPFAITNKIPGSPAVADVDNDGDLEVVIAGRDGSIYVVQHDGSGTAVATAAYYLLGSPALSDLDGDGDLEIVTAGFGYDVMAIHHDGTTVTGYPVMLSSERMSCGVSLADLDNDGSDDIIVGTWSHKIHALNVAGNELAGFPVDIGDDCKAPPVIADLNGDDELEILVGQDDGVLYAISATGQVLWTHATATSTSIRNAAAPIDIEGDGLLEIVYAALDGSIYVVDHAGNTVAGWPQSVGATCYSSPVVADLDGDGVAEIIVGSNDDAVYAFHADGTTVANFPVLVTGDVKGTATLDDLDQDGNLEIVIGTASELVVIDVKDLAAGGDNWNTARGDYLRTGAYLYGYQVSTQPLANLPERLTLDQNYPNPFNPATHIRFGVPEAGIVSLIIYDVRGQEVATLVNDVFNQGWYELRWSGQNNQGKPVETGIYFTRIQTSSATRVVKMMLIK